MLYLQDFASVINVVVAFFEYQYDYTGGVVGSCC